VKAMARDLLDFSAGGSNNVMVFSCPASSENQYSLSAYFFEQAAGQNIQKRVELKIPELIGGDLCFFRQHHRNVIPNLIDPFACLAFKSRPIGQELYRSFAKRAHQNIQQILSYCHAKASVSSRNGADVILSKRRHARQTAPLTENGGEKQLVRV
jgi:hypothetical protein